VSTYAMSTYVMSTYAMSTYAMSTHVMSTYAQLSTFTPLQACYMAVTENVTIQAFFRAVQIQESCGSFIATQRSDMF
jgi:hypothetical protein